MSARAGYAPAPAGAGGEPAGGDRTRPFAHRWVFALTVAFLWAAAVLRCVLAFDGRQRLLGLALLAAWLVLMLAVPLAERVWAPSFAFLLAAQCAVILVLLTQSDASDYFAVLLAAPTMQAMERWRPRAVAVLISVFAALTGLGLASEYGVAGALPLVALYAATNVFFAAYVFAARRAVAARARSEALAADLREANRRLVESGERAERLGAARERQQLARDLHDSVTQTLFSMTLTAQSALLLLRRDAREVTAQLDLIDELARAAVEETAVLGAGTGPATGVAGGLTGALRRHCAEREERDGLVVTLEVDGEETSAEGGTQREQGEALSAEDELALLRIVQEGLNNVVKHAGTGRAVVRLRPRPLRLEVEDEGSGFEPRAAAGAGLGLVGMRERATERGWRFSVNSHPGAGTRLVVQETGVAGERGEERGRS